MINKYKIYILPTFNGLKLFALNVVLLLVGLFYGNNFILYLNFFLFSIFFCSLIYTHYNLTQIGCSLSGNDFYAHQLCYLKVHLENLGKSNKENIKISLKDNKFSGGEKESFASLKKHEKIQLLVPIIPLKRGVYKNIRIELSTQFPFGFFRSFTYFSINTEVIVYPSPLNNQDINLKNYKFIPVNQENDDIIIRNYSLSDSASRIHWKKSTLELQTKSHPAQNSAYVELDFAQIQSGIEYKCSFLTSLILKCENEGIKYSLLIPNKKIKPNIGPRHKKEALKELAQLE